MGASKLLTESPITRACVTLGTTVPPYVAPQDVCCNTAPSWQGGPLRAPVASPRPVALPGIGPNQRQRNVSPFHLSQTSGRCTTARGSLRPPPRPHGQRIAVGSRPKLCALDPIDQPCADWTPASVSPLDHDQACPAWTAPKQTSALYLSPMAQRNMSLQTPMTAVTEFGLD